MNIPTKPKKSLCNETQAADFLGLRVRTLQQWRVSGKGPQFVKLGRSVRYSREALEDFVAANTRSHTA